MSLWSRNMRLASQVMQLTAERDHLLRENARMEKLLNNVVADSQADECARAAETIPTINVLDFRKEATLERRLRLSVRRLG